MLDILLSETIPDLMPAQAKTLGNLACAEAFRVLQTDDIEF